MKKVVLAVAGIMFIAGAAHAQSASVEVRIARDGFRGQVAKPTTRPEQKKENSLAQHIERKVTQAQTQAAKQPKKEVKKAPVKQQPAPAKGTDKKNQPQKPRKYLQLMVSGFASVQPFK